MEKIKITFLGTGSAIPTEKRNHPSVFLEYKNEGILFDCGEGTQRQFRKAHLNPCKITRIFVSHWHGDHVLGIPGLLQTLAFNNYNKELKIYGPVGSVNIFNYYSKLFINKKTPLNVSIKELRNDKIEESDFEIVSREMEHDCNCIAFSFKIKDKKRIDKKKLAKFKLPSLPSIRDLLDGKTIYFNGKKIEGKKLIYIEKGKKISYVTDTRLNKNIGELIKDSDVLISEATYLNKEKEIAENYFHLTAEQIANEAKKAKVKKLFLFHLSQRYEKFDEEVLKEARKKFKESFLARDFDKIVI